MRWAGENAMTGDAQLAAARARVQADLTHVLDHAHLPEPLQAAVRHAVLLGGKRVRPALVYAACEAVGCSINAAARRAAVAVELIHCYSLVHDDLPCMDDDALRRGLPTCHVRYGEATALLAGDLLQSLAFEVLSSAVFAPECDSPVTDLVQSARQLAVLAQRSGRMVVGQVLDLQAEGRAVDEAALEQIHVNKTGALIDAAIQMGALAGGLTPDDARLTALVAFGRDLGLAFQVQDDVLDVTATTEALGKPDGSDQKLHKSTYPVLLGLEGAQTRAIDLHQSALAALTPLGVSADGLRAIAAFLLTRQS
jgi:farnesyl diphosphate synthase